MSSYLAPSEMAAYGLPASTTAAAIVQASNAVDFVLRRPEGLLWAADATGAPAYMAGLTPTITYTLTGPISPGANVPLSVTPPIATQDLVGDVLILDRGTPGACEAVRVSAVTGPGAITAAAVRFPHAAEATADQGLLIAEERSLPARRSATRVTRAPLVRMVSAQGRYSYGRRSDQAFGYFEEASLLSIASVFGGVPPWIDIDPAQVSVSPVTGEVWFPGGMLNAYYSDVRVRYVAGWQAANLPPAVKSATAQIITGIAGASQLTGSIKSIQAGDTRIVRDAASYLDSDTRMMLEPYAARILF